MGKHTNEEAKKRAIERGEPGYCNTSEDTRIKPGEKRNPKGVNGKKPRLPLGNGWELAQQQIMDKLVRVLITDASASPPPGPVTGAQVFARSLFSQAVDKGGAAFKLLASYLVEAMLNSDRMKPKDESTLSADRLRTMAQIVFDPTYPKDKISEFFAEVEAAHVARKEAEEGRFE